MKKKGKKLNIEEIEAEIDEKLTLFEKLSDFLLKVAQRIKKIILNLTFRIGDLIGR